jgi:GxxExxY protein
MDNLSDEQRRALNGVSEQVIGAGIEVHRHMGPGLIESVYEDCLCVEFELRRIPYRRQLDLPLVYKGRPLRTALRIDVLVGEGVIVEVKAAEKILPVHSAQLLSYLRLSGRRLGLLLNFNVPILADGITRMVDHF